MLRIGTYLNISDNSGALVVKIIHLKKKKNLRQNYVGINDLVTCVVKKYKAHKKVKKKEIVNVLVTMTKKKINRKNGCFLRFKHNSGAILDVKRWKPLGSRITSPLTYEFKQDKRNKAIVYAGEGTL